MHTCGNCGTQYTDGVSKCPNCGTLPVEAALADFKPVPDESANDTAVQPIWLTRSTDEPLDDLLFEDSLEENPSGLSSDDPRQPMAFSDRFDSSHETSQGDFFTESAEFASSLFENMSPKLKRFVIFLIISTLLSIIPFIYLSCTHKTDTIADGLKHMAVYTISSPD